MKNDFFVSYNGSKLIKRSVPIELNATTTDIHRIASWWGTTPISRISASQLSFSHHLIPICTSKFAYIATPGFTRWTNCNVQANEIPIGNSRQGRTMSLAYGDICRKPPENTSTTMKQDNFIHTIMQHDNITFQQEQCFPKEYAT